MFHSRFTGLDRAFHWLALQPQPVRELSFDLDRSLSLPKGAPGSAPGPSDGAVYVCGLARSGTTMLLRILDQLDTFRSLSYRDMPFVLAPNLWRRIVGDTASAVETAERAHGDGIQVDVDSPESFEQVFWRTFTRPLPDRACFGSTAPTARTLKAFADYRAMVANPASGPRMRPGHHRYLSKNNNNLLRLDALCGDATATVLLAYRDPVATADSLFRQHERFGAMAADDPFVRRYMDWLEHFEFGPGHRPFCFARPRMDAALTPDSPDYWLDYWCAVYEQVVDRLDARLFFVGHDALRQRPAEVLRATFAVLGVTADADMLGMQINPPQAGAGGQGRFRADLLERAAALHARLLASPRNVWRQAPTEAA